MKEGKRRAAVEEVIEEVVEKHLLKVIRIKADMEEIRKLGGKERKSEEMLVKLKNEDQKKEIMRRKRELKDRREKVMEDWTWKERKMKWKEEEIIKE